jgi:tetratricopeptide (TPR) repeat protein
MSAFSDLEAAGKYKEAIALLQQNPTYDANYFFNLGVLFGKDQQPGLAVAYLEKSSKLRPHDPEILKNLKIAQPQLKQQLLASKASIIELDGASNSIEKFADRIQQDEIMGVIGLVVLIVSLLWIRAYLKTRNITKTFLKPSGWFGALAVVLSFAFYGVHHMGSSNPPAILLMKQPLRSGPGMNYPEIISLDAGIKVRMVGSSITLNETEGWQKIRYNAENTAWIPLSSLLPL